VIPPPPPPFSPPPPPPPLPIKRKTARDGRIFPPPPPPSPRGGKNDGPDFFLPFLLVKLKQRFFVVLGFSFFSSLRYGARVDGRRQNPFSFMCLHGSCRSTFLLLFPLRHGELQFPSPDGTDHDFARSPPFPPPPLPELSVIGYTRHCFFPSSE